jgi:hypothetical protein
MPPLQLAGSELNSTLRLSIQWGPGPFHRGKVIGRVTGYKIDRKKLKYIEEYFDIEDQK